MTIRLARPGEDVEVHALVERAYARYVERIGRRPQPMDDDYAARVADGQAFVADDDGTIAGVIVLVRHDDHLYVDNLAVEPERQGAGVGRALLAHAERTARDLGLGELRLLTHVEMTENRALYPRLGWRETGRRDDVVLFAKRTP